MDMDNIGLSKSEILDAVPGLKEVITAPIYAWPTIGLFLLNIVVWSTSTTLGCLHIIPIWIACIINGLTTYSFFTILHDASHHAVSLKSWLNELIGWLSLLFFGPVSLSFRAFRYLHIQHHRFTNDKQLDPDFWVSRGPFWLRPLMIATVDINYLLYYFPKINSRPKAEKIGLIPYSLLMLTIVIFCILSGYGWEMLFYWIIPSRIAIFLLSLGFDYLPHFPHKITEAEDPYQATSIREGFYVFWSPILFYQNYHLAHHLYPTAPFYCYKKVWLLGKENFMPHHPAIVDAFGRRKI